MSRVQGPGPQPPVIVPKFICWFDDDDNFIGWQEVNLNGTGAEDDFTQGSWTIASIGPYYLQSTGKPPGYAGGGPATLTAIEAAIGGALPWWWILGQTAPPPYIVPSPSAGASKPYYF